MLKKYMSFANGLLHGELEQISDSALVEGQCLPRGYDRAGLNAAQQMKCLIGKLKLVSINLFNCRNGD